MGLLEKARRKEEIHEREEDIAHEVLERLEDAAHHITPTRVIFASIAALLLLSATMVALTWAIPYNKVNVDVVYRQGGPGHIILVELDNQGSRAISEIELEVRFLDEDGLEIGRTSFERDSLSAHTSIAGDELELLISGESVWDNYTIDIRLNYDYYGDDIESQWSHNVGQWTMEMFSDSTDLRFF